MKVGLGFLFTILLIGAIVAIVIVIINGRKTTKIRKAPLIISVVGAVAMLMLLITVPFGIQEIDSGEVAVVKRYGQAVDVKTSGMHFSNVFVDKYERYDIKTQQLDVTTAFYTTDSQPATVSVSIQFRIKTDKDSIIDITTKYGNVESLKSKIEVVAIEKIKATLAMQKGKELIKNRAQVADSFETSMISLQDHYYVIFEQFAITEIDFSDTFEAEIEATMKAEEEALRAQAEADKKRTQAEADKEVARIEAEKNAEVARIKAESDLIVAQKQAEVELAKAKGQADAEIAIAKGLAQSMTIQTIEVARMLGFEVIVTNFVDTEGNLTEEISGYEIIVPVGKEDDVKLIKSYIEYIAYLNAWDGKLPEVVVGDIPITLTPTTP